MFIIVADENFAHDREYVYGIAKIPLISLVFNQSIKGEFDLKVCRHNDFYLDNITKMQAQDEYGFQRGSIFVSLEWSKPYKMDIVPVNPKRGLTFF